MNIAFIASHNGSSAKAIAQACLDGELMARPTLMISNNEESHAMLWAKDLGLKTVQLLKLCERQIPHLD